MTLPTFRSLAAKRKQREAETPSTEVGTPVERNSDGSEKGPTYTPGVNIKLATKTRRNWIILSSLLYFISVVFLILTEIGNINKKKVIRSTYFFKLNLSDIIPASVPGDLSFTNSLARSLGLHDFYQIGLWGFCEGYNDEGITSCSHPKALYWFNPVEIILNELLSGATIALPADINNILKLIRIASHLMSGFFLTGTVMNFLSIFLTPITLYSRWYSFPFALWTFIGALLTTAATIIATVMFIIFRNVITSQAGLNIGASVGTQMFAFMWIGSACSIFGWLIHAFLGCCCASRRDVITGKRKGRKSAYGGNSVGENGEKGGKRILPVFRRRKTGGEAV